MKSVQKLAQLWNKKMSKVDEFHWQKERQQPWISWLFVLVQAQQAVFVSWVFDRWRFWVRQLSRPPSATTQKPSRRPPIVPINGQLQPLCPIVEFPSRLVTLPTPLPASIQGFLGAGWCAFGGVPQWFLSKEFRRRKPLSQLRWPIPPAHNVSKLPRIHDCNWRVSRMIF